MERKTKILLGVACAAVVVLSAAPRLINAEEHQAMSLPAAITTVALHGDGAALRLGTHTDGERTLDVVTEDNIGCPITSTLVPNGDTLEIHVKKSGARFGPWCDPDVTVSLPEGLNLTIGLDNLAAEIKGTFEDVAIRTGQSVVDFDGRATHFQMQGDRAAVRLNFAMDMAREAVDIDVGSIMSQVTFTGT